ncbi:hypothetical protein GH714_033909 [Hevea brasiliensis]|uniref:Integrase catalytic domain-containing protein n=1 Tax=Hevea brasiliensis TaxID=3981 RepID=A0A6A6L819_HEVBR|nr:hypothetical protein GH714_033909 [Hevea brasiliensis]
MVTHPFTAKTTAKIFTMEIIRLHGMPESIVSDRDPVFLSNFLQELLRLQGTSKIDGQTKVSNCCLETYLRCFTSQQRNIGVNGCIGLNRFNTSFHTATGMTPFQVVYGIVLLPFPNSCREKKRFEAVSQELFDRDIMLRQRQYNLQRAQQRMLKAANAHRQEVTFEKAYKLQLPRIHPIFHVSQLKKAVGIHDVVAS